MDYIPTEVDGRDAWLGSFAHQLSLTPGEYGQTAASIAGVVSAIDAAHAAWLVANQTATRTADSIASRDALTADAVAQVRVLAKLIKAAPGVSDAALLRLGLRPNSTSRTPIYVPDTRPGLMVLGGVTGSQTLTFNNPDDPTRRGKPFGARSIQVWVCVNAQPVADVAQARLLGNYTRGPIGVAFDAADNGKTATYFARWQGTRGDLSPVSAPVSMTIAA